MESQSSGSRRMVIYARISDDREGRMNGVERQERQCRTLASRNGDEVIEVFVDDDRSAYSGKPRPGYGRMIRFLEDGHAEGVLALAPTRLYRRLYEPGTGQDALSFLEMVDRRSLAVETVKQGRYDLSTADGRRDAKRAALDAEYESDLIGERVRDAKQDNLRDGTWRGGPRPFGFEADGVTHRPDEARHIVAAVDRVLAGDSLRSICQDWAADGIQTVPRRRRLPDGTRSEPESSDWQATEFRRLLLRPRNAGLIDHKGEVVGKAVWDPIVPEEKWRAVKDLLEHPERRTTTGNARRWLGAGLFLCGSLVGRYETPDGRLAYVHTGTFTDDDGGWPLYAAEHDPTGTPLTATDLAKMHPRLKSLQLTAVPEGRRGCRETMRCSTSGKGSGHAHVPAYRCRGGAHVTRVAAALDDYISQIVVARLSRPDAVGLFAPAPDDGEPTAELAKRAGELRARLDQYAQDYDDDVITRKQFLDGTARTRERVTAIEAEMARRTTLPVLAKLPLGTPQIADLWEGYSLERKRAIIDALMTVTVLPARRGRPKGFQPGSGQGYFDPDAVRIDWRRS